MNFKFSVICRTSHIIQALCSCVILREFKGPILKSAAVFFKISFISYECQCSLSNSSHALVGKLECSKIIMDQTRDTYVNFVIAQFAVKVQQAGNQLLLAVKKMFSRFLCIPDDIFLYVWSFRASPYLGRANPLIGIKIEIMTNHLNHHLQVI